MGVITLVCSCGMRLKAPGAVPGRVGKCPRCGSMLRVPGEAAVVVPDQAPAPTPNRETFVAGRTRRPKPATKAVVRQQSDGLVPPPKFAESRLVDSLTYPLWNISGIGLLAFLPPVIAITTLPLFTILPMLTSGSAVAVVGVVWAVPQLLILLVVGGYVLLFLGQVLTTSASGEVLQPRSPGWDLGEIGRGLLRWWWALVIGLVVGGFPPLVYWFWCGDVDWLDRIVLVDLVVPGMAYAQMALLASLVHDSPMAANPATVIASILRVGWAYLGPCLLTGSCLLVLGGIFAAILQIRDGLAQLVAYWGFWVVFLYVSMVPLRRLGLFCFRHAVVLNWFPQRDGRSEGGD